MNIKSLPIPHIVRDSRGVLGAMNFSHLPFPVKRAYWLTDFTVGIERGGHAHKELIQFLVVLQGRLILRLRNAVEDISVELNSGGPGLLVYPGIWRQFAADDLHTVLLVLASEEYDEGDYVRDFDEFLRLSNGEIL